MRVEPFEPKHVWIDVCLTLGVGAAEGEAVLPIRVKAESATLVEPVPRSASARVVEALGNLLQAVRATEDPLEALRASDAGEILSALMPVLAEGTVGHWIEHALPSEGEPVANAVLGGGPSGERVEILLTELQFDRSFANFGAATSTYRLTTRDAEGEIVDVREERLSEGNASEGLLASPLTEERRSRARAALARFREATSEKLGRIAAECDPGAALDTLCFDCPCPGAPLPNVPLLALVGKWIENGPPGPRPCPLHLDEACFARGAALVPVEAEDLRSLRERLEVHAVEAYRIGAWTIVLGPFLNDHDTPTIWEDQINVIRDGEAPAVVMMSDPTNAPTWLVVDGDAGAYRGFARWMGEALTRSGHDHTWRFYRESPRKTPLEKRPFDEVLVSEWLRLGDRWREQIERDVLVDWRVQLDTVIPDEVFWDTERDAAKKAALEAGAETWHRFLREVIDPSFTGRKTA
ncbi:MAG: hypothetical protein QM765_47725 [Myxococcales bacterium]